MLDAQPAATAPARPPAVQPLQPSPANADTTGVRPKPAALLAAATALVPNLEAGRTLDAKTLREAMSAAFGASDTQGAWVWKDAYEAAEAAMVLFVQRYGRLMRREAGAGPGSAAAMLAMLETLAALEPSQTRRSEEQLALQQFSTPLPLAYAALQAAAMEELVAIIEDPGDVRLPPLAREALGSLVEQLRSAQARIKQLEVTLLAWHRSNEASRRLATIPGVGVITATALVATIGDGAQFRSGRQLSAWLGLVPRQHSSGGKDRLGRISKRGDGYIRRLLVHGARTVLRWRRAKPGTGPGWTVRLLARRPTNVVLVAMANKTARVAWALLRYERIYRPTPA